jgi:hypothetical protein
MVIACACEFDRSDRLGEQTVDVFLSGSEQKTLDFTFKASHH